MVSTRQKMYHTNSVIKKKLINNGFTNLYLFPHLRHLKDYYLDDCGFDAIGWEGLNEEKKHICLFQFKTNCKPPKKELILYKKLEKRYLCKCYWVNKIKGKVFIYDTEIPEGHELL